MSIVAFLIHGAVQKNNYVSGKAAGWLKKKVQLETFFFFSFLQRIFFSKMDNIFLPRKKKVGEKNAAARLASVLAIRWTGNRFFYGQPGVNLRNAYPHGL